MRWPWVRRSTFDATVAHANDAVSSLEKTIDRLADRIDGWRTKSIGLGEQVLSLAEENRELKDEIERLKSGIAAAINSLRPGEAE